MKVILLERVEGTGTLGDVVTVKDGFARNFLLPRHKALRANSANLKSFDVQRAEIEARNVKNRETAGAAGDALDDDAVARLEIGMDKGLSSEQKKARLAALDQRMPAALREEREAPAKIIRLE